MGDVPDTADERQEIVINPDDFGQRLVQRKVHLFQCSSVQQSLKRFWDVLTKNEDGRLPLDGYIDLNVRLQKCLTSDFDLERALESALADWHDDVKEGQESMSPEDFAMFLFELCSLWCNMNVELGVYLFFLSCVFIRVTQPQGTRAVALKQIDDVQLLTSSFFDLLAVQQDAKTAQAEDGLDDEQAFGMWYLRNFGREQEILLLVQRQVFTVTHDARSVLLFRSEGQRKEADLLELVKNASIDLNKVFPAAEKASEPPIAVSTPLEPSIATPATGSSAWWLQNDASASRQLPRRGRPSSVPLAGTKSVPVLPSPGHEAAVAKSSLHFKSPSSAHRSGSMPLAPQGRQALHKESSQRQLKGLVMAGQAAMAGHTSSSSGAAPRGKQINSGRSSNAMFGLDASSSQPFELRQDSVHGEVPHMPSAAATAQQRMGANAAVVAEAVLQQAANYVTEPAYSQPYNLPRNPGALYKSQTEALLRMKPSDVSFAVNVQPRPPQPKEARYDRVLQKLPERIRPPPEGPSCGPMHSPNEAIWLEMGNRLDLILKKVRRRVERRRKRKQRSKLFRGRNIQNDDGQGLRRHEHKAGGGDAQGNEYYARVHERYLLRRDSMGQQPPRGRGAPTTQHPRQFAIAEGGGPAGISQPVRPKKRAARPVYVPPPASSFPK